MEARSSSSPRLEEEGPSDSSSSAAAAPLNAPPRETVLGNCARCGSGDRLKFCSRCQAVRYCGRVCQPDDVSERPGGGG